jgi:unsaturated rhamnogalacturonyl hydrolase
MLEINHLRNQFDSITRREWIKKVTAFGIGLSVVPSILFANGKKRRNQWLVSSVSNNNTPPLPKNKSIPFDWNYAEIPSKGEGLKFSWSINIKDYEIKNLYLRITSGTDIREEVEVSVLLAKSKIVLAKLKMDYAHYFQPFQFLIPPEFQNQVLSEGVLLTKSKGENPVWIFIGNDNKTPDVLSPHLFLANDFKDHNQWKKRLLSTDSIQTFGWMEGCVLDGIYDCLKKDPGSSSVFIAHLNQYFDKTNFFYEAYNNERALNTINNVESLLPFAMLAKANPKHPAIDTAIAYCIKNADEKGNITDEKNGKKVAKTEECYTVSYPLAMLSRQFNRPDLMKLAIATLQYRYQFLESESQVFQRMVIPKDKFFSNWGRGIVWLLLGSVKTIPLLPEGEEKEELKNKLKRTVELVLSLQQENGLWFCFINDPKTGIETSGSAGIAAALAFGYKNGLLDKKSKQAAQKAREGLIPFLTADGLLTATSQVNKGGEVLQREGFRVISNYTLGFLGILEAAS